MPLTSAGREALEALTRESADFERRHAHTLYQRIPLPEIAAQRARDIEIHIILERQ